MYDISQAEKIAAKLNAEKVDGLFIINCKFGCEEVAGKVAQFIPTPNSHHPNPSPTAGEGLGLRYILNTYEERF